jgi:hypothetical protein
VREHLRGELAERAERIARRGGVGGVGREEGAGPFASPWAMLRVRSLRSWSTTAVGNAFGSVLMA